MSNALTVNQLANYLKLSKCTVYRMVWGQRIPYFYAGKKIRFFKNEIDKWIEASK